MMVIMGTLYIVVIMVSRGSARGGRAPGWLAALAGGEEPSTVEARIEVRAGICDCDASLLPSEDFAEPQVGHDDLWVLLSREGSNSVQRRCNRGEVFGGDAHLVRSQ